MYKRLFAFLIIFIPSVVFSQWRSVWISGSGGASTLSTLDDVSISGIADGEGLKWDAGLQLFIPVSLSGSGTVTSFSAGTLSPLFTTSVATATTTPALSFTLSNVAAGLVYAGPKTGAAAAPSFKQLKTAYADSVGNDGFVTNVTLSDSIIAQVDSAFVLGLKFVPHGAFVGNTETLITVTYQIADHTVDFVVNSDLSLYSNVTSKFFSHSDTTSTLATQFDLTAKQPLDADLTALAANSTDGLWAHTGAGTGSARTLTGDTEIVVSNGDGVAGNPTLSIASTIARDSELPDGSKWNLFGTSFVKPKTAGVGWHLLSPDGTDSLATAIDNSGNATYVSTQRNIFQALNDNTTALQFKDAAGNVDFNYDATNARIGVGTANPQAPFELVRNAQNWFKIVLGTSTSPSYANEFGIAGSNNDFITGSLTGDAIFKFAAGSKFMIGSAQNGNGGGTQVGIATFMRLGNVGIMTTAPDRVLEVNLGTSSALRLSYADDNGSAVSYTDFTVSSSGDMTITPSGADVNIIGTSIGLGAAGVRISNDGDGALTFLGMGNGNDEDLILNLDDGVANTGTISSNSGLGTLIFSSIILQADYYQSETNLELILDADNNEAASLIVSKNGGSDIFSLSEAQDIIFGDGTDTPTVTFDVSGTDPSLTAGDNKISIVGNLGINESSPAARLEVEGGFSIGDTTGFVLTTGGTATITSESNIILDTFGAAALDTVVTLTGAIGQIIYISTRNSGRDVRFLDAGNFSLNAEITLSDVADVLVLKATSATTWKQVHFSDNN